MKVISNAEHKFLQSARKAVRYRGEPTASAHMDAAEKDWGEMVKAEAKKRRQIEGEAA